MTNDDEWADIPEEVREEAVRSIANSIIAKLDAEDVVNRRAARAARQTDGGS